MEIQKNGVPVQLRRLIELAKIQSRMQAMPSHQFQALNPFHGFIGQPGSGWVTLCRKR